VSKGGKYPPSKIFFYLRLFFFIFGYLVEKERMKKIGVGVGERGARVLTLNLPTTTIVAQPFLMFC
jgi:hypothetical protein